jgi:hypothetical protein
MLHFRLLVRCRRDCHYLLISNAYAYASQVAINLIHMRFMGGPSMDSLLALGFCWGYAGRHLVLQPCKRCSVIIMTGRRHSTPESDNTFSSLVSNLSQRVLLHQTIDFFLFRILIYQKWYFQKLSIPLALLCGSRRASARQP